MKRLEANRFSFLRSYTQSLAAGLSSQYRLMPSILRWQIKELAQQWGVELPEELEDFYEYSYGAILEEYEILTIEGIAESIAELERTYEEMWKDLWVPLAYVRGVGDVVAFNLQQTEHGLCQILDGFHEVTPDQWKPIGYGLESWLRKMCQNNFRPFWLPSVDSMQMESGSLLSTAVSMSSTNSTGIGACHGCRILPLHTLAGSTSITSLGFLNTFRRIGFSATVSGQNLVMPAYYLPFKMDSGLRKVLRRWGFIQTS